jgi:hypothetical protein
MVKQVVETNSIFSGAEGGKSFYQNLNAKQFDTLIHHNWPDSKTSERQMMDPLEGVIQNIKKEQEDSKTDKKGHKKSSKKSLVEDEGILGTKNARLNKLISIGHKLRSEGCTLTNNAWDVGFLATIVSCL